MDFSQFDGAVRALLSCNAASFAKDAVDLAQFLLGKYLFCPNSDMGYIRIIETEAYPSNDEVYVQIFGKAETQRAIPDQAGVLFRLTSSLQAAPGSTALDMSLHAVLPDYLYVTADKSSERGQLRRGKPLVLIRSCMPEFYDFDRRCFTRNPAAIRYLMDRGIEFDDETRPYDELETLMIDPHMVAEVLEQEFTSSPPSDPVLYTSTGCRLFSPTDPQDPAFEPIWYGKRILKLKSDRGINKRLRYLLETDIRRSAFQNSRSLIRMNKTERSSAGALQALVGPSQSRQDIVIVPYEAPRDPEEPQVPMDTHQGYVPVEPQQMNFGPPQAPMGPQQMYMLPPQALMEATMGPQQMYVLPLQAPMEAPMGPQQMYILPSQPPMGQPAPGFSHFRPP